MKPKILLALGIILFAQARVAAQSNFSSEPKFKYRIWIHTVSGNVIKGILIGSSDSTVQVYPGSFSDWKKGREFKMISEAYSNISIIYVKKRAGWLKGMLIGGLIGAIPIVFGEAGGYVVVVTFPLGLVSGAIIGGISKKKFEIGTDPGQFKKFHQKVSKKENQKS